MKRRGSALLELTMPLPFVLTLFIGLSDVLVFFVCQSRVELAGQIAAKTVLEKRDRYLHASQSDLAALAAEVQATLRKDPALTDLSLKTERTYSCPQGSGRESAATKRPSECAGERAYLRIEPALPYSPILKLLRFAGVPDRAYSELYVRLR